MYEYNPHLQLLSKTQPFTRTKKHFFVLLIHSSTTGAFINELCDTKKQITSQKISPPARQKLSKISTRSAGRKHTSIGYEGNENPNIKEINTSSVTRAVTAKGGGQGRGGFF